MYNIDRWGYVISVPSNYDDPRLWEVEVTVGDVLLVDKTKRKPRKPSKKKKWRK